LAAGNGTVVSVQDSRYFFDGFGISEPDWIKVGSSIPVRITAVDDTANTITVASSISWNSNDPVFLAFSNTVLVDRGAYPYRSDGNYDYTVALTNPANNSSVSGIVAVTASVTNPDMVRQVVFHIDGLPVATVFSAPYTSNCNTNGWTLGTSHIIEARAYSRYAGQILWKVASATVIVQIASQELPLASGWNWISFNVLPADTLFNSVFGNIFNQIEQVKSQTQSAIRINSAWKGDLADMNGIGQWKMYKVKVSAARTLTVTGSAISPTTSIALVTGWNWVAYLPTTAMPIATALDSIKNQVLQVKSSTQSATYSGGAWTGALQQLNPGQGYAIKMSGPQTLIYPAIGAAHIQKRVK
jgi:hypothetical protein